MGGPIPRAVDRLRPSRGARDPDRRPDDLSLPLNVSPQRLWSPDNPYMYSARVELLDSEEHVVESVRVSFGLRDIKMALSKGLAFAVLVVFISCHQGLNAKEGAVGVGRAPTEAVVIGSLAILVVNFFLSFALNIIYPAGV